MDGENNGKQNPMKIPCFFFLPLFLETPNYQSCSILCFLVKQKLESLPTVEPLPSSFCFKYKTWISRTLIFTETFQRGKRNGAVWGSTTLPTQRRVGKSQPETQIGALILDRNPDFVWEPSRGGRSWVLTRWFVGRKRKTNKNQTFRE